MAGHLHKAFSDQQVRALLERYVGREIKLEHILGVLKIIRTWFFGSAGCGGIFASLIPTNHR